MRRIGILLAALGLVLVIGVGLLVMRALKSIEEEERLRHEVVAARLIELMRATGIPNGVSGVGYGEADIPALTDGAYPQRRLLDNAPLEVSREALADLYRGALRYW
jgi:alcohol dehydrogenase class IV